MKIFNVNPRSGDLPLLFVARMLVIYLLWIRGLKHIYPPFLPFLEVFDALRDFNILFITLNWVYWVSLAMIMIGWRFKSFSLLVGVLIFLVILFSKLNYSNSFLYSGCILFLIGIYRPGMAWIFRVQIALLYLGAGLNKLFDPDWLSGQYFDFFFSEVYLNPWYADFSSWFPKRELGQVFSFFTILTELGLGIWALTNRRRTLLVLAIHVFHLSMLVMTSGELSFIFYFLMAVSSYLLLPWDASEKRVVVYPKRSGFFAVLRFLDFDKSLCWSYEEKSGNGSKKILNKNLLFSDLKNIFLYHKVVFGLFVVCVVFLSIYKNHLINILR